MLATIVYYNINTVLATKVYSNINAVLAAIIYYNINIVFGNYSAFQHQHGTEGIVGLEIAF